jgi:hypothetical protein
MIANAVNLILRELRAFLHASNPAESVDYPEFAVAGNIAFTDAPDPTPPIRDRVVLTVVNIAEETTFKNAPHFERSGNETRYRNAPKYLNLFVLFSANYANYETALRRLSQVVTFFQGKNVFTLKDSPHASAVDNPFAEMRLIMELFALTFEQVNYLWASLGGKQIPFVMFKVRLVRVQADRATRQAPIIHEIVAGETTV